VRPRYSKSSTVDAFARLLADPRPAWPRQTPRACRRRAPAKTADDVRSVRSRGSRSPTGRAWPVRTRHLRHVVNAWARPTSSRFAGLQIASNYRARSPQACVICSKGLVSSRQTTTR
jgi:hypothetical protein